MTNPRGKRTVLKTAAFVFVLSLYFISSSYAVFVKGWLELKGGIQFIDTSITKLTSSLDVVPSITVSHEFFPMEISYSVISDNMLAGVVSFGYDIISGQVDQYYAGGGLAGNYKVDFSRMVLLLGGRKYFGSPGKDNNSCWYFGGGLGVSKMVNANINHKTYSIAGNLTGDNTYTYESIDIVFRAGVGGEYWLNKNFGFGLDVGYVWGQPHIGGTEFALEDRDFSGVYIEASFLTDFMAFFEGKNKKQP